MVITLAHRQKWGMMGAVAKWSKQPSFQQRFWDRIKSTEDLMECWQWIGSKHSKTGYGKYKFMGKHDLAHRIVFRLTFGEIPKGKCILHQCDNRLCCNPNHLRCGTYQDNMDDMVKKGRQHRPIGDKHHNRKLSSADVIRIRELKSSMGVTAIGRLFKVSHSSISNIVSGKGWKSVPL